MPQLDKVTFFSQFFWLCVFFFGFYVVALKYFLPEISRILKFRKKRLGESLSHIQGQENVKVRSSTERLLENAVKNAKQVFKQNSLKTDEWLLDYTSKFNQNNLKKANNAYLLSIGEKSLSHNLAIQGVNNEFSTQIFLSLLAQRMLGSSKAKKILFSTKGIVPGSQNNNSVNSRNIVTKSKSNKPSASNSTKTTTQAKVGNSLSDKTKPSTKASKKKGK